MVMVNEYRWDLRRIDSFPSSTFGSPAGYVATQILTKVFNLKTAVGSKKSAQILGAPGKIKKCPITKEVITNYCISPGAAISYTLVLRPTAVFRLNTKKGIALTESIIDPLQGWGTSPLGLGHSFHVSVLIDNCHQASPRIWPTIRQ